jgi:hypothetical protein
MARCVLLKSKLAKIVRIVTSPLLSLRGTGFQLCRSGYRLRIDEAISKSFTHLSPAV